MGKRAVDPSSEATSRKQAAEICIDCLWFLKKRKRLKTTGGKRRNLTMRKRNKPPWAGRGSALKALGGEAEIGIYMRVHAPPEPTHPTNNPCRNLPRTSPHERRDPKNDTLPWHPSSDYGHPPVHTRFKNQEVREGTRRRGRDEAQKGRGSPIQRRKERPGSLPSWSAAVLSPGKDRAGGLGCKPPLLCGPGFPTRSPFPRGR